MARLIVGDDENASYAKPSGGAFGSKPFVLWPQRSGGTRYVDLLYVDNSPSGSGTVNGTTYTGGVLLTGSVDGAFGAQLPDGLDVPGVWVEFDGRPARVFLHARQADGTEPASAQAAATAAVAAEITARQNADIAVQSAAATDATSKANAAQAAATSAAATDATAKANAAQAAAIAGAPVQAVAGLTGSPTAAQLETAGLLRSSTASATYRPVVPVQGAFDGVTDDTAAWNAAFTRAAAIAAGTRVAHDNSGSMTIRPAVVAPAGTSIITSTLTLPRNVDLDLDPKTTVRAGSALGGYMLVTGTALVQDGSIRGGTWDCNSNAAGMWLRYFAGMTLENVAVLDSTGDSYVFGDTGLTASFGVQSRGAKVRRSRGVAKVTGSRGYWTQNCTDSCFTAAELIGPDIGVRNDSASNRFYDIHAWAYSGGPTIGFDDNGVGEWHSCQADDPVSYGFRIRAAGTRVVGGKVVCSQFGGSDNTIIGVYADVGPWLTVGMRFEGQNSSHRLAAAYGGPAAFFGVALYNSQQNVASAGAAAFMGNWTLGGTLVVAQDNDTTLNVRKSTGSQVFNVSSGLTPQVHHPNGYPVIGYSDNYVTETWRVDSATGAANFKAVGHLGRFARTGTVETMTRREIVSSTIATATGRVQLTYFVPTSTITVSTLTARTGSTAAAATPTLCRMGLYSVDPTTGALALIASTPNDTTLFAATFTDYAKALTASVTLTAGTVYAFAILVVSAGATPAFYGNGTMPNLSSAPRLAGAYTGQTDLPASIADASLTASGAGMIYSLAA